MLLIAVAINYYAGSETLKRRGFMTSTTLIKSLSGAEKPTSGRLRLSGDEVDLDRMVTGGAGKSTLAQAIVDEVGDTARVVGMDEFHLSRSHLAELGRLDRMGAIETLDGWGFVALLRRLRDASEATSYAPEFRREVEESVASGLSIEPDVKLVVAEGNHLLASEAPWGEAGSLLDEVWYGEPEAALRVANLIARHQSYGKSEPHARPHRRHPRKRAGARRSSSALG